MKRVFLAVLLLSGAVAFHAHGQASLVILARHAEKASPSGDVGLSAVGEQRARHLATALREVRLTAIITTQLQRTRLTAGPTAAATGLEPLIVQASGNSTADAAAIARTIDSLPADAVVLVVGHSNTIAPIIAALGGPTLPDLCDGEYATLFILHRGEASQQVSLVRSRYGEAEPPEAGQCPAGR